MMTDFLGAKKRMHATDPGPDPRDAELERLTGNLAQEQAQHAGTKKALGETFEQAEAAELELTRLRSLNQVLQTALLGAEATRAELVRAEAVAVKLLVQVAELTARLAAVGPAAESVDDLPGTTGTGENSPLAEVAA